MLQKTHSLTKKKDFGMVFKKGGMVKNDFLILRTLESGLKESRFGFVVSKKVSTKATLRNKIKRRLRQAVFNNLKKIKKSIDVVVVALPGIEKKSFLEIREIINKFFGEYYK